MPESPETGQAPLDSSVTQALTLFSSEAILGVIKLYEPLALEQLAALPVGSKDLRRALHMGSRVTARIQSSR